MAQATPKTAAQMCEKIRMSRRARTFLEPGASAGDFLHALVEAACWDDAVAFMTHTLPPRQAVWWGCLCVRHTLGKTPTDADKRAVLAATRCVVAPGAEHHREAMEVAAQLDGKSPNGCLVRAAVHLGAPARPDLAVQLTAAAIKLAIAAAGPARRDFLYRQYIFIGLDVARAALPWKQS